MYIVKKRTLALFLALTLALCAYAPGTGLAAVSQEPIRVTVTVARDNAFPLAKNETTVEPDLSERCDYPDAFHGTQTTVLDALVAAHIALFGAEALHEKLVVSGGSGFVTTVFGVHTSNFVFYVNGSQPGDGVYLDDPYNGGTAQMGYSVLQAALQNEDDVLFVLLQDDWAMDYHTWFESDGRRVQTVSAKAGETIDLTLRGYMGWYGYSDAAYRAQNTEPVEDAAIALVKLDSNGGFSSASFGETLIRTNEHGAATVQFDASGTYILSAYDASGDQAPIIPPWLVVTVTSPSVTFRLIGATPSTGAIDFAANTGYLGSQYQTWIKTRTYSMNAGDTVYDLLMKANGVNGVEFNINSQWNYLESVKAPTALGGYWLSSMINGPNSGWLWTLGGKHGSLGIREQTLRDGDSVIVHYVNHFNFEVEDWFDDPDYPKMGDASTWNKWLNAPDIDPVSSGEPPSGGSGATGDSSASPGPATPDASAWTNPYDDVGDGDWFYAAVRTVSERDLMKGEGNGRFAPNQPLTRAMFAAILYRMEGQPPVGKGSDGATNDDADSRDESGRAAATPGATGNFDETAATPDEAAATPDEAAATPDEIAATPDEAAATPDETVALYTDVEAGQWYTNAVAWASEHNLVNGYGNKRYGPNDDITRAQLAVMLHRYAAFKGKDAAPRADLSAYEDAAALPVWATDAMRWAVAAGLVTGRTPSALAPTDAATRAEAAAVLARYLDGRE